MPARKPRVRSEKRTDSQSPEWMRGFNDGMACAVEELLLLWEEHGAELLIAQVHVEELTREQVRRMRRFARRPGGGAPRVVEALRTAKSDPLPRGD